MPKEVQILFGCTDDCFKLFHLSNYVWVISVSLLLLLSHFSRVWLCVTPETAAHQAPLFLGFSRQEHWSGLPFPSSMNESEKWKWSHSVCLTLRDPMDCSPPGSSVHGIFQARVLEWVGIATWQRIKSQQMSDGCLPLGGKDGLFCL